MILSIDIETVPQPGIMDTWYPEWAAEKHPDKTPVELEDMAALYPEFGMICAISIAVAERDGNKVAAEYTADSLREEGKMLCELTARLSRDNLMLVGHNIKGFDIPYISKRCLAHEVVLPGCLRFQGKKPWEIPHKDTMEMMRFGGGTPMSLRAACHLLGISDPKDGCNGKKVQQLFREGRMDEISTYCTGDALAALDVYRRLIGA